MGQDVIREMVKGTDGDPVYLVLGDPEGLALGIRPVVLPQPNSMFVGWRVRLCNHDNTDSPKDVKDTIKDSTVGMFDWGKVDHVRASTMFGAQLPLPIGNGVTVEVVMDSLSKNGFVANLVSELGKHFEISHPVEDVVKFSEDAFGEEIGKLMKMIAEAVTTHQKKMPVGGSDTVH